MSTPKLRAAIYTRISLDRTGEGLGVERQQEDCEALARQHGYDVVASFSDNDISAYSGKKRPGYEAMLAMVKRGEADVVLAWHTDRLHRSLSDLEAYIEACEANGVSTVTVRAGELDLSSAAGRMVARMLGSVARHESEQKSERIRRARRQAAESGKAHGHLGYGYDADNRVIQAEALVIREVARRLLDGEPTNTVARDLNRRGVPTPGAGIWRWQQVRRILRGFGSSVGVSGAQAEFVKVLSAGTKLTPKRARALAAAWPECDAMATVKELTVDRAPVSEGGTALLLTKLGVPAPTSAWRAANLSKMIQRGSLCGWRDFNPGTRDGGGALVAKGSWEPILEKAVTERLRAVLNAPGRTPVGRHPKGLLVGVLKCGRCGGGLVMNATAGSYRCTRIQGTQRCGALSIKAEPTDELVTATVLEVLSDAAFRSGQRRHLASSVKLEEAATTLAALDDEEAAWRSDLAAGQIDRPTFLDAIDGVRARRKPLEQVLGTTSPSVTNALAGVPVDRQLVESWWADADVDRRRRVVRALIERVEIAPARTRGQSSFDASRVGIPAWRA